MEMKQIIQIEIFKQYELKYIECLIYDQQK